MPTSPQSLRLWVLFAVLVAVMQFSDPLGDVALGDAILFWAGRITGMAVSLLAAEYLLARFCAERLNSPVWLKPAILTMVLAAVPMTITDMALESFVPQSAAYDDTELREWSLALAFVSEYLTILSIVLPANVVLWIVIDRNREAAADTPDEPDFLKKANGIALQSVIALAAEEHYVRVFTAGRSELVYGRFRDVVAQMPDSAGLQVHRSWWVADAGVVAARRGERRYTLVLSDGTEVPVSDRFTRQVRERGLLARSRNP